MAAKNILIVSISFFLACSALLFAQFSGLGVSMQGTSSAIGGSLLTAGTPSTTTITVAGAAVGMGCIATPGSNALLTGTMVDCYVSSANTVTLRLMGIVAVTPASQTYIVKVIP